MNFVKETLVGLPKTHQHSSASTVLRTFRRVRQQPWSRPLELLKVLKVCQNVQDGLEMCKNVPKCV